MDRRNFIKIMTLATVSPLNYWHNDARAFDPITISACINMGLTAASFFGPPSIDIATLIETQSKLLMAISGKIDILHDQMKLVVTMLEDVQKKLGNVPVEVVSEINSSAIRGQSKQIFAGVLEGYTHDRRINGIVAANAIWKPKISDHLKSLAHHRSQMTNLFSPFAIPSVSIALRAETAAAVFCDESDGFLKVITKDYESFFLRQSSSCAQQISQLKDKLIEADGEIYKITTESERRACIVNGTASVKSSPDLGTAYSANIEYSIYQLAKPHNRHTDYFSNAAYFELRDLGYLNEQLLPPIVDQYPRVAKLSGKYEDFRTHRGGGVFVDYDDDYQPPVKMNAVEQQLFTGAYAAKYPCPDPEVIQLGDGDPRRVAKENYIDLFEKYCFYSAMHHASKQALDYLKVNFV